jgi:hypothetical protein
MTSMQNGKAVGFSGASIAIVCDLDSELCSPDSTLLFFNENQWMVGKGLLTA